MGLLSLEPISGWGRHPVSRAAIERPETLRLPEGGDPLLPRGLGPSSGAAAIPATPGARVIETTRADRVLDFDAVAGTLTCEAGLSLAEILRVFLPRGWFPPVTPGTKFVTIGGGGGRVGGRQEHSPVRWVGNVFLRGGLPGGGGGPHLVAPAPGARALPRHGGRDGAHRPHHGGDAQAPARGERVDAGGHRAGVRSRCHDGRAAGCRQGLAVHCGLDRLPRGPRVTGTRPAHPGSSRYARRGARAPAL